jgi:hypothetical protein
MSFHVSKSRCSVIRLKKGGCCCLMRNAQNSGVCKVTGVECGVTYTDQTGRSNIAKRFSEHIRDVRYNEIIQSTPTFRVLVNHHGIQQYKTNTGIKGQ